MKSSKTHTHTHTNRQPVRTYCKNKTKQNKNTLEEWKPDKVDGREDDETVRKGIKIKLKKLLFCRRHNRDSDRIQGPQPGARDSKLSSPHTSQLQPRRTRKKGVTGSVCGWGRWGLQAWYSPRSGQGSRFIHSKPACLLTQMIMTLTPLSLFSSDERMT